MIVHQTATTVSKASKVMQFINSLNNPFLAIGRSYSWDLPYSDSYPPKPDPSINKVPDLISIIRLFEVKPALVSPCGNKTIQGVRWHVINKEDVRIVDSNFLPSPTHVYVSAKILPSYYTSDSFRIMGILTNTTLKSDANPGSIAYPPSFIKDQGILHWVAYSSPFIRLDNKEHILELVIDI